LNSIETDTNFNKLYVDIKERKLYFNGLIIKIRNKSFDNYFVQEALKNNEIAYPRIKRLPFNEGYHYYVELVMKGNPPKKIHKNEDKNPIHHSGDVGIDIGTSTIAVSSGTNVFIDELAPNNNKYVKDIKRNNRALDRSRRATNPDYFNEDGTIKRRKSHKEKRVWNKSNNYKKLQMKNKTLYRKRSAYIKQEHETLANYIISLGNTFYVEKMNFAALQKKAKKGEVNKKGKPKKRKRFGTSLQNRAPAELLSIIDRKLSPSHIHIQKVNTNTFKASQYNHVDDEYIKSL
jgi:hypothetical protein